MAQQLQIAALNPNVAGENTANAMQQALGNQLRPVPVSPGLMVYLDQVKRARLIRRWNDALSIQ
jgi:iron(III) transport system substrate-binding protein